MSFELEAEFDRLLRANVHYLLPFVCETARSPQLLDRVQSILGPNRSAGDRIGLVFRFLTPSVRQLVSKRDYAMMMRGIDSGGNWIHVAPPTGNYATADLRLHERIKQDQSAALADGATQTLHKAY